MTNKRERRIEYIANRLSTLKVSGKHIVYFVTEDREAVRYFLSNREVAGTVRTLSELTNRQWNPLDESQSSLYDWLESHPDGPLIADAYEMWPVNVQMVSDLTPKIPVEILQKTENNQTIRYCRENGIKNLDRVIFFVLNDFQIVKEQFATHYIKKFLSMAKAREKEREKQKEDIDCIANNERKTALARELENTPPAYLFLTAPTYTLPAGFESEIEIIDVPEMSEDDIFDEILYPAAVRELESRGLERELDQYELEERVRGVAKHCKGLPRHEIESLIRKMRTAHTSFFITKEQYEKNPDSYEIYLKTDIIREASSLRALAASHDGTITLREAVGNVAGQGNYTDWIEKIKPAFLNPKAAKAQGSDSPTGVLMTGIAGGGKTTAAEWTAQALGENDIPLPLVELRLDNLLGGHVGDSEASFKRLRKRVDAMAPCVVFIDEIEKIFGTEDDGRGGGSHEVKKHLLTALLQWLTDNKKQIFFFFACNDIRSLHDALLRRLTKRYSVFMPAEDDLAEIFNLHLEKLRKNCAESGLFAPEGFEERGRKYGKEEENYSFRRIAKEFLNWIADQYDAQNKDQNMLYTGANIRDLILNTNRRLWREGDKVARRDGKEYLEALKHTVESGESQPHGMTSMNDIVKFWLSTHENSYANTSKTDLFIFDENKKTFKHKAEDFVNPYDRYLFKRISDRIMKELNSEKRT